MMARNTNVPFKGRIQKRKTNQLHIVIFGLQRAAGPYRRANFRSRGLIRYAETSSEGLFAGLSTAWSCAALDAALRCLGVFEIDFPYVNQFTLDACELA
jgi:hypothetical protein